MITVTDSAFQQLQNLLRGNPGQNNGKGLRISIKPGGCAGMQYGMTLDSRKEGDEIVERDGAQVLIDPGSAEYLRGSVIDYTDGLSGAGFKISNPNARRSCGCGTSFEAEAGRA